MHCFRKVRSLSVHFFNHPISEHEQTAQKTSRKNIKIMARANTITPIFAAVEESVSIAAVMDIRKPLKDGTFSIAIRVSFKDERWYLRTGVRVSEDDYQKICNAAKKGVYAELKSKVNESFKKVLSHVQSLNQQSAFSITNLKNALEEKAADGDINLLEYWEEFGKSKKATKTQEQYRQASRSFYRSLGCSLITGPDPNNPNRKKTIIKGAKTKLKASQVNETVIAQWEKFMDDNGLSAASKSIYMRAFRAVMNSLTEAHLLKERPKITIKAGARRKEDFIQVPDIIKIRDYQGQAKKYADWWIIIYLCNGSNLKDLAMLRWNDDYFYNNELSFIRAKIADKVQVTVRIPVTEDLKKMLSVYASAPKKGQLVFPQILLDAQTQEQIDNRVHDFNRSIRRGMQSVCKNLGIRPVTASTARNSYITTLTWHGISDAFIDSMVGHVDNKNVLRGYQGTISPKKRMKVNNLLFDDPEIDDDDND